MNKKHQKPEFSVITQNHANAKFFVASFENGTGPQTPAPTNTTASQASQYGTVTGGTDGTNDNGGFTF